MFEKVKYMIEQLEDFPYLYGLRETLLELDQAEARIKELEEDYTKVVNALNKAKISLPLDSYHEETGNYVVTVYEEIENAEQLIDWVIYALSHEFEEGNNDIFKTMDELITENQQLKEDAEIGRAWDWYYTECGNFYTITGGRLSKKRKYEMLKERVLKDYRESKEV